MQTITFIILILAAAVITYFVTKSKFTALLSSKDDLYNKLDKEVSVVNANLQAAKEQALLSQKNVEEQRAKLMSMTGELSEAKTINQSLDEKLKSQKQELEELQMRFSKEFENLANKILE